MRGKHSAAADLGQVTSRRSLLDILHAFSPGGAKKYVFKHLNLKMAEVGEVLRSESSRSTELLAAKCKSNIKGRNYSIYWGETHPLFQKVKLLVPWLHFYGSFLY